MGRARKPPVEVFFEELLRGVRANGHRLTRRQLAKLIGAPDGPALIH